MALFNSFQFGDVDSKDYGVYISGDSVYDSPARSVDLVQVPGRNGALALDNGYYENIEVTYPAGSFGTSQEEWREKMLGIRNALAAQRGYQKLIDTYHPEHYRLGMFFAGISASPVQYNRAGQFPIRFNCKPQRFLISGDEAVEFTEEGQEEVYGPSNIVSFEAEEGAEIRQLEVDLEPVQNLNGYDNPWPAGGGVNKLPNSLAQRKTASGITIVSDGKGTYTISGTATANVIVEFELIESYVIPTAKDNGGNGVFYLGNSHSASSGFAIVLYNGDTTVDSWTASSVNRISSSYNAMAGKTINKIGIQVPNGWSSGGTFAPMFVENGSTTESFAPYENACPISGHTEVNVYRTGKNLLGGLPLGNAIVNAVNNQTYASLGADGDGEYVSFVASRAIDSKVFANGFFKSNTRYTLILKIRKSNTSSNTNLTICYTDGSKDNPKISGGAPYDTTRIFVYSTAANKTVKQIELGWYSGTTYLYYDGCGIFEGTLTADVYEPYTSQTYSVPLGQTVYGGTLNVTTGVLNITQALVDLGTLDWSYYSSGNIHFFYNSGATLAPKNGASGVCSQYRNSNTAGEDKRFYFNATQLRVYDSAYTNAAAFKTAMSGVQLCYELATPTTVQLTPTEVTTLLGQNNIWSDAGEVEVKVASPVDLTNPTNFPAKPLIRIYGNGSVRVGDTIATVQNNADGYVDIDCESMNCYDTTGGRNADVSFSGNDFPELASGNNSILLTGPSKVEITPRWWEL